MRKDIPGYEGRYSIDPHGNVYNRRGRKLTPFRYGPGYLGVGLSKDGEVKNHYLHSLVARAYLGETPEGKEINHKDGDKRNASLENLEFITHLENIQHACRTGLMHCRPVDMLNMTGEVLESYRSLTEAARATGCHIGSICKCARGQIKSAGGHRWEYAKKEGSE